MNTKSDPLRPRHTILSHFWGVLILLLGCGGESQEPGQSRISEEDPPPPATQGNAIDLSGMGFDEGSGTPVFFVVEFSDFACGYCRRFHEEVFPTIHSTYVDDGRIGWKYIPFILGIFENAEPAAHVGYCAGLQGRFPEVRDRFFETQSEWKPMDDPYPMLLGYVEELGYDMAKLERCVWSDETRRAIERNTQLGFQLGIRGTPTFFVIGHGTIPGYVPLELFDQIMQEALAAQEGTP